MSLIGTGIASYSTVIMRSSNESGLERRKRAGPVPSVAPVSSTLTTNPLRRVRPTRRPSRGFATGPPDPGPDYRP
jgi:hypothetical protein